MPQISSVLAVATVLISTWTQISRQRKGAYMRDKIPMQKLEPKVQGDLYTRGA